MQVDIELLPAINALISEAENNLAKLIGHSCKLSLKVDDLAFSKEYLLRDLVSTYTGVSWQTIVAPGRTRSAADARHLYAYLAIKHLHKKPSTVARELNRDHTTVLYAKDKIPGLLQAKDAYFTEKVSLIERHLIA